MPKMVTVLLVGALWMTVFGLGCRLLESGPVQRLRERGDPLDWLCLLMIAIVSTAVIAGTLLAGFLILWAGGIGPEE